MKQRREVHGSATASRRWEQFPHLSKRTVNSCRYGWLHRRFGHFTLPVARL